MVCVFFCVCLLLRCLVFGLVLNKVTAASRSCPVYPMFEPVPTSMPVGVLVELDDEVGGHPHLPASELSLP